MGQKKHILIAAGVGYITSAPRVFVTKTIGVQPT